MRNTKDTIQKQERRLFTSSFILLILAFAFLLSMHVFIPAYDSLSVSWTPNYLGNNPTIYVAGSAQIVRGNYTVNSSTLNDTLIVPSQEAEDYNQNFSCIISVLWKVFVTKFSEAGTTE